MSIEERRQFPRIPYMVSIYDLQRLHIQGALRDISEGGVGIKGIEAEVGEIKTFIIPVDEIPDIDALVFHGQCRWVTRDDDGSCIAGFEITRISKENLQLLGKLIHYLTGGTT